MRPGYGTSTHAQAALKGFGAPTACANHSLIRRMYGAQQMSNAFDRSAQPALLQVICTDIWLQLHTGGRAAAKTDMAITDGRIC